MSGTGYDLVIVGGGLVGGTLACALGGSGLRVALIEAVAREAPRQPSYDERILALSWGSARILQGIGLWDALADSATPIRKIHISDRGHFGFAHLDAQEESVPALGYVIPARTIGQAIQTQLQGVEVFCPAQLLGFHIQAQGVQLEIVQRDTSHLLQTALLVAADGGDSAIRKRLGFAYQERSYGQDAIITTVTADRPRPGVAFERFTETGPLALLPLGDGRYSVVWTARETQTQEILAWPEQRFLDQLQERFGYRLGTLSRLGSRRAYPLILRLVPHPVQERAVLIGNAAHSLHPVAGQGFNLGLRDVAALAQTLVDAVRSGADPGGRATLSTYRQLRGSDQQILGTATDLLIWLFTSPWPPVRLARSGGLLGLDLLPGCKHRLARYFMGLHASQPRLARGLPL